MIQIDRIEQIQLGQGERLLSRTRYNTWAEAMVALRQKFPQLTEAQTREIETSPDTQIGPVMELVRGAGTAYSAAVLYDVRELTADELREL